MNADDDQQVFAGLRWPLIVAALLGGHAVLMMVAISLALSGPPTHIPEDYYGAATDWNSRQAARRASEALGWRAAITPSVVTGPRGERRVTLELVDATGRPVEGANVTVRAYHHARAGRVVEQPNWDEAAPGLYAAELRMPRDGLWQFAVRAARGPDTFLHDAIIQVWPVAPQAPAGQGGPR